MESKVKGINGVTTKVTVPPLGNVTPTLGISWDKNIVKLTTKEFQEKLRNGSPSIEVIGIGDNGIQITAWVMKAGEEKIVGKRLAEEFASASA